MAGPNQGEVYDGYRFMGGDPKDQSNWQQVAPVDVSSEYGAGARRLPNGTIERVGPRGGVTKIADAGSGVDDDAVGKLTEGQGKATLYGAMMSGAERDYQDARSAGYNPASLRNQAANIAGIIPFDGDYFGRLIRDDVSDRGRQAELRWAEANLRQLTGAAATNPEVARVAAINFDRGNDELSEQRYRTRADTFKGTSYAAGPGAKALGDYPALRGAAGPLTERGLPSYPEIAQATKDVREFPIPEGGYVRDPNAPKPGDVRVTSQPLAPEDTPESLTAQGYVYDPKRDVWTRTRQERVDWTPEGAVAQRREMNPILRGVDAIGRGAADVLGLEMADEIAGIGDAVVGRGRGETFGERAANNIAVQRAVDAADGEDVPWLRRGGQAAGLALSIPRLGAQAVAGGVTRLGRAARLAGEGAAVGGLAGFGAAEGNAVQRAPNALGGAAIGAVAAPIANALGQQAIKVATPVAQLAGRNVGRAMSALGVRGGDAMIERSTPNALRNGLTRLSERQGSPNAEAMSSRMAELEAMGIQPTAADLVDDAGRGTLRALATRQTPARQAAREFAESRAVGLQDRISNQARRTISDDVRTPDQIRADVSRRRSSEADQAFGAVRDEIITPERSVIDALRSPATRTAVEDAAVRAANRGDVEIASGLRQLVDGALDDPNGVQMTIGMADRIARTLNGRGETLRRAGDNDGASAMFSLAERLRGPARAQSKGYNDALEGYAADSRLMEAADLGEQFLSMEADQFASAMSRLSPYERAVAQASARRAVERSAGTRGQAPGVAQRLAGGREQQMRNAALLDDPRTMQAAMAAEREMLMNARGVSPAQGSPTNVNQQDTLAAAGEVAGAVRDVATGNVPGIVTRLATRFKSRGFNDAEAEAVVMAAIDPRRTREVIDLLAETGMTRTEARRSVRTIRRALTQDRAASAQAER